MTPDFDRAAANLFFTCAELQAGDSVLICHETNNDYYDIDFASQLAVSAERLGLHASLQPVAFHPNPSGPDAETAAKMAAHSCTIFLARLGDQLRFDARMGVHKAVISYALDRPMFASAFGQIDYRALVTLKGLIDEALANARDIRITCPLGTDVSGPGATFPPTGDTTLRRFPLSVFTPVLAQAFSGTIAQSGFLVGTGSRYYEPYAVGLKEVLNVTLDQGRITGFTGQDAERATAHYEHVSRLFDLDPWYVHSWHAGIHPGLSYQMTAAADPARWSGAAFGNPRLLHFHSCGAYPPGEISLNIVDPTVEIDEAPIWDKGRLCIDQITGGEQLVADFPELADALAAAAQEAGTTPDGRLSEPEL